MKFGWRRDLPDQRDWKYSPTTTALPKRVDLRPQDTPIYNQGNLGSCTANAIAAHLDFNRKLQHLSPIKPSRLFIYYNERVAENSVDSDSGASIRDSVKEVKNQGAVPESDWPYLIKKFKTKPPAKLYAEAVGYEDLTYLSLDQDLITFKSCLADGYPFVGGITVYSSFPMSGTPIVPIPEPSDQVEGGHALMFVGYDDDNSLFIVRNSWGSSWGDKGYFYIPYIYLTNPQLASDFWSLRQVKSTPPPSLGSPLLEHTYLLSQINRRQVQQGSDSSLFVLPHLKNNVPRPPATTKQKQVKTPSRANARNKQDKASTFNKLSDITSKPLGWWNRRRHG